MFCLIKSVFLQSTGQHTCTYVGYFKAGPSISMLLFDHNIWFSIFMDLLLLELHSGFFLLYLYDVSTLPRHQTPIYFLSVYILALYVKRKAVKMALGKSKGQKTITDGNWISGYAESLQPSAVAEINDANHSNPDSSESDSSFISAHVLDETELYQLRCHGDFFTRNPDNMLVDGKTFSMMY